MMEQGLYNLRDGIVLQAVKDYRNALAGMKVNGKPPDWVISECESFFHSVWFEELTGEKINPEWLIKKIRQEITPKR